MRLPFRFVFILIIIRKCTGEVNLTASRRESKLFFYSTNYDDFPQNNEIFDFIIVGAGTSGSVLANRLSEVPQWNILLLEAGIPPTEIMDIPAIAPVFQFTPYNWKYLMEKQENMCLGIKDQKMSWPRGKGLGGSSLINYMIHVRGNKLDYDKWAAMGNPGWSYKDLHHYFNKVENAKIEKKDPQYHGNKGYVTVEDVKFRTGSAKAFVAALQEMGYKYVDYNGHQQIGVSFVHATLRNRRRCSAEKAYLRPAQGRNNLKIIKRAYVTKILIDPKTKEAQGVRFQRDGVYYTATAKKEVILSAGAFSSPQLLMLSGIGPKDHLNEMKIPVIQNLPVGQKMYDHLMYPGIAITLNRSETFNGNLLKLELYKEYYAGVLNELSSLGGVEALAYMNLNLSNPDPTYPDIELIFLGGGLHSDKGLFYRRTFRITDKVYYKFWKPLENKNACQVLPMLVHPRSYGHVKLRSKNPYDYPKLYGNFFTDEGNEDVKTFIASIRAIQKIIKTKSFRKYNAELVHTRVPGCESYEYDSDSYWECGLRHLATTLHHQVSTCKMGPIYDREAVVDNTLKVYGVNKLRVVDCSVIPLPLTAHTNVPAFAIAEKASDIIKQEYFKF